MESCKRQILVCLCCCLNLFVFAQAGNGITKDSTGVIVVPPDFSVKKNPDDTSLLLIADITVRGTIKTKPYIIDRELPFKQGDYIPRSELAAKLLLAQQRVMNTALFTEVAVYIHSLQGDLVFINIDVKERWYLFPLPYFKIVDRNFNQWWVEEKASLDRVNYGIKFIQNNVTGRNDKLNINLITGYSRQVQLKYEQPFMDRMLKKGYSIGFNFSRQRELNYGTDFNKQSFFKQDDFVMQNVRGELAYLYRPAINTRHTLKFAYVTNTVSDTILKLNPNYFPSNKKHISYPELSYTIQYTNADYIPYPSKGVLADASVIRRGFFNNDIDLTQLQYHASYTFPIARKSYLNLQSIGIIKFPFNQPYYNEQLFGYGDAFLRGMEYYVIDGVAGLLGRATARREILSFTLRTPPEAKRDVIIPFHLFVKAGGDMGYAYSKQPGNSMLNNKFLYTECVGLDILITSYDLLFKFEYSFNQLGDQGLYFHVRSDF